MVRAKNCETVSTFVKVMQKITVASFFSGHGDTMSQKRETPYSCPYLC